MSAIHVCPWWLGYLLASPIRRIFHKPETILKPYVQEGMRVLDVGCAMGFFSIPMAQAVGPKGRVICVDVQERMIRTLKKRAAKAGVAARLETYLALDEGMGLPESFPGVNFALVFAMMHEVPNAARLLAEIYQVLLPGGQLLIAEPRGHVTEQAFAQTVKAAEEAGFQRVTLLDISKSHAVLLARPNR
jgi:ubiquinone/menaquinone biosynthesis C-methylase UbiE